MRASFAGLYEVDDKSGARVLAVGGKGYVMKPQREGGGNNIYESDIPAALAAMPDQAERRGYIFMSMIRPPAQQGIMVRSSTVMPPQLTLSELGIYSSFLGDGRGSGTAGNVAGFSRFVGHLLRTKAVDSTEGGVASGYSVLDSPLLV